jgi:predicted transcriptional regulator
MVAAKKPDALMVALEPEDREQLAQLAKARGGSVEELVKVAVQRLLAEAQDAELDRRLAKLRCERVGIPHDEAAAYLLSLGTDKELPCPKPR